MPNGTGLALNDPDRPSDSLPPAGTPGASGNFAIMCPSEWKAIEVAKARKCPIMCRFENSSKLAKVFPSGRIEEAF